MFNVFGKKNPEIKITDKVWMSENAKWTGCNDMWKADGNSIFVAWFEETYDKMKWHFDEKFKGDIPAILAREISYQQVIDKKVIFVEHFPLKIKEQSLFASLHLSTITIASSLDEPFFEHFGGEKIIQLMKTMGITESEAVENPMISRAIKNAQEKIERKMIVETSARSQKEWFAANFI